MRLLSLIVLVIHAALIATLPAADGVIDPKAYSAPVKVACVGDSITAGAGAAKGLAYPDQLSELLGSSWNVRNFGVSGRTLLRKGDLPYWKESAFTNAKAFLPDVVVILLGANDTKPKNWVHKDGFATDYADLIAEFANLPSKPRIFLGRPCPVPAPGNFGINEEGVQAEIAIIDRLATERGLGIIDFHAALRSQPQFLPDRVHPNADGYAVMAATVCRALTGAVPQASCKPATYFRSHAVLPRGVPVPVWGTGVDGTTVQVSFAGQQVSALVANQRWRVDLAPLTASATPSRLTIADGRVTLAYDDVLVGDVWLASGQSNMERQLGPRNGQQEIHGWKEAVAKADYPLIRQFYVIQNQAGEALAEARGTWSVCSPATAADITAVGFFFARDLQPAIGVPLAIIHSSWGGTPVETWMSPAMLAAASPDKKDPKQHGGNSRYHAMIAPLRDIPITGVIWYQGESNSGRSDAYCRTFSHLITGWRDLWRQPGLPFLFVQIAPHEKMPPELREAQLQTLAAVPRTAMVVTTDIGHAKDIHPPRKAQVGERLARAAKSLAYGSKDEYSGPLFRAVKMDGSTLLVEFDHAGGGLTVQDGGELKGFTIAGEDGVFVPAMAKIVGSTVALTSTQVVNPVAVRYGWANIPEVNLANSAGLPASPFRSRK